MSTPWNFKFNQLICRCSKSRCRICYAKISLAQSMDFYKKKRKNRKIYTTPLFCFLRSQTPMPEQIIKHHYHTNIKQSHIIYRIPCLAEDYKRNKRHVPYNCKKGKPCQYCCLFMPSDPHIPDKQNNINNINEKTIQV